MTKYEAMKLLDKVKEDRYNLTHRMIDREVSIDEAIEATIEANEILSAVWEYLLFSN